MLDVVLEPTDHIKDEVELVAVITAGEQRSSCEQFRKNAANGPDINGLIV